MLELFQLLGSFAIVIIIGLIILVIALIKAIFDIRNNTKDTTLALDNIEKRLSIIIRKIDSMENTASPISTKQKETLTNLDEMIRKNTTNENEKAEKITKIFDELS